MEHIDLFEVFEDIEMEQLQQESDEEMTPDQLVTGDIVRFKDNLGKYREGIFVTKGFWDGRDQGNEVFYYFEVKEDDRSFFMEINPYRNKWVKIGHDDDYCPPSKLDVKERLIKALKLLPFEKRLDCYKWWFTNQYPHLSYEYHPLISQAWDDALIEISTEEEAAESFKKDGHIYKFPRSVKEWLKDIFESDCSLFEVESKFDEIRTLRWIEKEGDMHLLCQLNKRDYTFYKHLLSHYIENAKSFKNFLVFCGKWGVLRNYVGEDSNRFNINIYKKKFNTDELNGILWQIEE
ncbi:hypothetical protein [Desertibacillus haloalkaliphilus]|uniref:hypothetical protein n=1 Tax=Desertibacillus haloalkaliphilus TaxID=1328930 RepID=UPI001C272542|nr:hypothetical protein [Desertibacillus haloalkaliphilus]MBU8908157.1 hypothetical protein [Desertibacillus haloalkaliphilus]